MLKNKTKIITLIIILIVSLFSPIVNAENKTNSNEAVPISEIQEETVIKEGDEYLFQKDVNIETPIDGNLFVIANTVTINSQIGGDAFICAETINVEDNAYILSNLFASANTINIRGIVYNIYSIGDNLTIDGFVYRDIRSMCNTLNINSMVGRNVFVNCSSINFKEKSTTEETPSIASYGNIQGDLNYFSYNEIMIPENSVAGETHFTQLKNNSFNISTYIYSLGAILVSAIIIWLLSLWISPKLLHTPTHPITLKKALQIIGLGILVPIIIALLSIIITLIPITNQFTMFLLCILAILVFISTSVTIIDINSVICNKLKMSQNSYKLGALIITTFMFWILTLIPYVNIIIYIIAMIWGIGTVSYNVFIKEKSNKKALDSEEKIEAKTKKETKKTDESENKDKKSK